MYLTHSCGLLGCGKTTLLHCIVGCLKVDRGTVMTLGARAGQPQSTHISAGLSAFAAGRETGDGVQVV